MIGCGSGFSGPFSVIMIGLMIVSGAVCWTGSILGGGTPVSRPKGTSSRFAPVDLALIGGPASRGVRNAFSQDPGRGSLGLVVTAGGVAAGGVWVSFSVFRWAAGGSSAQRVFIRVYSICE